MNRAYSKALLGASLAVGLALLVVQLVGSIRQLSATWDESFHLLAGLRHWQAGDFGINPEHPPPLKLVAALPLWFSDVIVPQVPRGTGKQEGFVAARSFLYANDAASILFRARVAAAVFLIFLALAVFEATRVMFGAGPAMLALALFVFEPNLLAHGALITTDSALACGYFVACYAFYRYLSDPSPRTLAGCGILVGLGLATKHSGVLLLPALFLVALAEALRAAGSAPSSPLSSLAERARDFVREALRLAAALALIYVLAYGVLWGFYRFRFAARPEGLQMTPALAGYIRGETGPGLRSPLKARTLLALERFRLLPESYLYGLADVMIVSAGPRPSFLLGQLRPTARWYYFPVAFVIKSTLAFLVLLAAILVKRPLCRLGKQREVLCLLIPAGFYFAFSLTSGLNVGVRHLLPVFPFLIAVAAGGAWHLARLSRGWTWVVGILLAAHAISSLRAFPNYLAYSNEIWGGHSKTYRFLTDSNADWGQGLIQTRQFLKREGITDCWLAYFGSADPDYHGVTCKMLPDVFSVWWGKPIEIPPSEYEGVILISATQWAGVYYGPGDLNPYSAFHGVEPVEIIGGSILVFRGRYGLKGAHVWSRVNRAWRLAFDGHPEEALEEATAAAEMAPRLVFARYTLGYLLAQKGEIRRARDEYDAALDLARKIHPEYQWFWVPYLEKLKAVLPAEK